MRGSQPLHPADGELRGEHAAQPLMFRRVEAEQIARPRTGLLLLRDVRRPGHDETGWPAVGEPLVVGQHRFDVLVPGDEIDLHAERADDGAHAGGLADLPKLRSRVERIAPHVQGQFAALGSCFEATCENTNSSMSLLTSGGFSNPARWATPSSTAIAAPGMASAMAIVSVSGNVASSVPATTRTGVDTCASSAR